MYLFSSSWSQKDLQGHRWGPQRWGARQSFWTYPRDDHVCSVCQWRVWLRNGLRAGNRSVLLWLTCQFPKIKLYYDIYNCFLIDFLIVFSNFHSISTRLCGSFSPWHTTCWNEICSEKFWRPTFPNVAMMTLTNFHHNLKKKRLRNVFGLLLLKHVCWCSVLCPICFLMTLVLMSKCV